MANDFVDTYTNQLESHISSLFVTLLLTYFLAFLHLRNRM